jgi:hypothetical protein
MKARNKTVIAKPLKSFYAGELTLPLTGFAGLAPLIVEIKNPSAGEPQLRQIERSSRMAGNNSALRACSARAWLGKRNMPKPSRCLLQRQGMIARITANWRMP